MIMSIINSTKVLVATLKPLKWALWPHGQRALLLKSTTKIAHPTSIALTLLIDDNG